MTPFERKIPWTIDEHGFIHNSEHELMGGSYVAASPKAAKFILKAVNNHDALVQTVLNLVVKAESDYYGSIFGALDSAKSLLKKLEDGK